MKSTRTLLSALGAALMLGLLAGLTVAGPSAGADPATTTDAATTSSTPATTSTAPDTTSTTSDKNKDTTTTTSTAPTTSTTPETTTAATTTAPTTTVGSTTEGKNEAPPSNQTTTQASSSPTGTAPQQTTTAPCDTTAITCGNNAATQVALVSQTCNANSANSVINVTIQTLDGHPVNNLAINPTTNCLNYLSITQIVHQYCINCTVIVIPPPSVTNVTNNITNPPPPVERVMGYCTDSGLQYLQEGQPTWDPTYAKAYPATYAPGYGMTCPDASAAPNVPMFTLTVPASLVGQYLNLCLQPKDPNLKPTCHAVRIDTGATVSIPVSANVNATVLKTVKKAGVKAKTKVKAKPKAKPKAKTAAKSTTKAKGKGTSTSVGTASNAIAAAAGVSGSTKNTATKNLANVPHPTVPKGAQR